VVSASGAGQSGHRAGDGVDQLGGDSVEQGLTQRGGRALSVRRTRWSCGVVEVGVECFVDAAGDVLVHGVSGDALAV
jgi:hypothetical protein